MAKVKIGRSAVTGKFVKKSYAKTHKRTTIIQTIKRSGSKKK